VTICLMNQYPILSLTCGYCFEKNWISQSDANNDLSECTGSNLKGFATNLIAFKSDQCSTDDKDAIYPTVRGESFSIAYKSCAASNMSIASCLSATCPALSTPCAGCVEAYHNCTTSQIETKICEDRFILCVGVSRKDLSRTWMRELLISQMHVHSVFQPMSINVDICSEAPCGANRSDWTSEFNKTVKGCIEIPTRIEDDGEQYFDTIGCLKRGNVFNLTTKCLSCVSRGATCPMYCQVTYSDDQYEQCLIDCYNTYVYQCWE